MKLPEGAGAEVSDETRALCARFLRDMADILDAGGVGAVGVLLLTEEGPIMYVPAGTDEDFKHQIELHGGLDTEEYHRTIDA